jgi:hypothetical protein
MPCPSSYRDAYMELTEGQRHDARHIAQRETPQIKRFLAAARAAISHHPESPYRQIFVTTNGMLGLGTPDGEPGDVVYHIKSYSMPSILQPSSKDHSTFIGSAYVHCIMDGQALGGNFN